MAELVATTNARPSCLLRIRSHRDFGETDPVLIERMMTPAFKAALPKALEEANARLSPPPRDILLKALVAAVALVMPAGFSTADKKLWLAAAAQTLKELPADLLERGIRHTRLVADHPSKIVPEIIKAVGGEWDRRKRDKATIERLMATAPVEEPAPAAEAAGSFSVEEIRNMPAELRSVAVNRGWLSQEEIDLALGEEA